jgi:PKD repeat protein
MKKFHLVFLLLVALGFSNRINAQVPPIYAGEDTTLCQGPLTLSAQIDSSLFSGTGSPTFVSLTDDIFSGVVDIGFSFTFFGNTYTQCVISSNNFITFNLANANQFSQWTIDNPVPSSNPLSITDAILGPWQDINPGVGGSVSYQTLGTAPNRKFVVEYCNVPMFSCTNLQFSSQIIIHETTNLIETQIINKPLCTTWNTGKAIHALNNIDGTIAFVVNGRNDPVQWTTANEGYMFTPTGPNSYQIDPIAFQPALLGSSPTVTWYEAGNPTPVGSGASVSVNPPAGTTQYVASLSGTSCGALNNNDTVVVTLGALPLSITGSTTYCQASGTTLSTNNTYLSYLWSTGATTQSISNVTQGTYTVTVSSIGGCTSTASVTVTQGNPQPVISSSNGTCITGNTTLSVAPAFASYAWSTGGIGATLNIGPGTYTVTATDANGCTGTTSFTVNANPVPVISGDTIYCSNSTATLGTTQIYAAYNWSSGGTGATENVTAGTYTVTVTDANGCTGTSQGFDVQLANPQVNISGVVTFCQGNTIPINATAGFTGYLWSNGSTNASITVGTGNYIVTVTDAYGCTDSDTVDVLASPLTIAGFNATISCYGQNTQFTNTSSISTGTIDSYSWNFGDSQTSNLEDPGHIYSNMGTYTVTMTATSDDGCTSSTSQLVTVGDGPDVGFSVSIECFNEITVSGYVNDLTETVGLWSWDFGDFSTGSGQIASHGYATQGTYPITLYASDLIGCVTEIDTLVTTKGGKTLDDIVIPNVISPNGDNLNDVITFDPEFEECSPYVFSVYNRWGIKVFETENYGPLFGGNNLSDNALTPGTYFIVIRSEPLDYSGTITVVGN